jgi:hypothetical protein
MTFEREFMAALCLGIVWVNTGLIVAHGLGDFRRLAQLRRRLAGTIGDFTGPPDVGPTLRIVQAGRSKGDGAIYFHDRRTEPKGAPSGLATMPKGEFEIDTGPDGVWVWPTREQVLARVRCTSQAEFDALSRTALHARGAERTLEVDVGSRCKVAGGYVDGNVLRADQDRPLVFSPDDPRARLLGLEVLVASVLLAIVSVAGLLTALCFVGPAFGLVSALSALGLFGYFLLVQPIGVWLSENVRLPHELTRGGTWVRARLPS